MEVDGGAGLKVGWGGVDADALVEVGAEPATAEHFQDPAGEGEDEEEGEEGVVDE